MKIWKTLPGNKRILLLVLGLVLLLQAFSVAGADVAVYSGTFDPIHSGHIRVIEYAIKQLHLDRIYVLPNVPASTKTLASSFFHRYNMTRLYAFRNPKVILLPKRQLENAYKSLRLEYVTALIEEIRRQNSGKLYHLCGSDSFEKMVFKNHLPGPEDDRIIVVLKRPGYNLACINEPKVKTLEKEGKLIFLDPGGTGISSTKIRNDFNRGRTPDSNQLPEFVSRYVQRNRLYGKFQRTKIAVPEGYHPGKKYSGEKKEFLELPLDRLLPFFSNLLLDFDRYISGKIPREIQSLILTRAPKVTIIGALSPEAIRFIEGQGVRIRLIFESRDLSRPKLTFILGVRNGEMELFVTNVFGSDRLRHLALQYAWLFHINLLDLNDFKIFYQDDYRFLAPNLSSVSLAKLLQDRPTVIFIGYRGSLEFVLNDFLAVLRDRKSPDDISLADLDASFKMRGTNGKRVVFPRGNPYFPYWEYELPIKGKKNCRIVAFRNLYGDQTGIVLENLLEKGFRNFVFFGNGGGLCRSVWRNELYAPTELWKEHRRINLNNLAAKDFPARRGGKVASILEEDVEWFRRQENPELIDVEMWDAASALLKYPDARVYSGILISDVPGEVDISQKDEDSSEVLAAKRRFFFQVLRRLWLGDF